ncbi:MAG: PaaI family thioesterase [Candidatus Promineifilaceae bacterium]|nr:PaaI family thioesterase [Candidatus Promineifilaceae bacterium]
MKKLPEHGLCFICGTANSKGIGVRWYADMEGVISTEFSLTEHEQGPPGHAHGGALAAILDEIMGTAAWNSGFMVMAANLNVDYVLPVPLGVPLTAIGEVSGRDGRKVFTESEIRLPDGRVAAMARGIFIEVKQMFTKSGGSDFIKWLPEQDQP